MKKSKNWFWELPQDKQAEYCSRLKGKRTSKYCDLKANKPLPSPTFVSTEDSEVKEDINSEASTKSEQSYYDTKSDHEWAKKSNVKNIGEDIDGSARHKRNKDRDWDSVESLLSDTTAPRNSVNADLFDKIDHIDFSEFLKSPDNHDDVEDLKRVAELKMYLDKFLRKPTDGYILKDYIDDFKAIRDELKRNKDNKDFTAINLRSFAADRLKDIQDDFNARKNSMTAEERTNFYNRQDALVRFYRGFKSGKTSVLNSIVTIDRLDDASKRKEVLSSIIKGKKFTNKKGPVRKSGNDVKESDFYKSKTRDAYVSNDYGIKNSITATSVLTKDFSIRGIQFGNSMNDKEREQNLILSAKSLNDLQSIFGLSKKTISMNGKLALSYGARGKGGAIAHYEPSENVLSFNKGSIGALAHEWSHAMSSNIEKGVIGSDRSRDLLKDLKASFRNGKTVKRIVGCDSFKRMSWKKRAYWTSSEEVFARTLEKYASMKLQGSGKKNNYLVDSIDSELWPTDEEVRELSPKLDELFASLA